MGTAALLALVVLAWTFPYYKVPHRWRDVFTTRWWLR